MDYLSMLENLLKMWKKEAVDNGVTDRYFSKITRCLCSVVLKKKNFETMIYNEMFDGVPMINHENYGLLPKIIQIIFACSFYYETVVEEPLLTNFLENRKYLDISSIEENDKLAISEIIKRDLQLEL